MDHDGDFVMMMYQRLLLDELKMSNMLQWNVDDDNQHNSDDNQLMFVEMIHQHLILAAEEKKRK
jgi:hypothetical protein